jgi:hypothetical protein
MCTDRCSFHHCACSSVRVASVGQSSSSAEGAAGGGAETNRIRTDYDGSHKQDLDWYRDVLQCALADKSLTPDEDALLASVRQKLKISQADHKQILKDCGWTHEEFEAVRKEDPWRKECCLSVTGHAYISARDCRVVSALCGAHLRRSCPSRCSCLDAPATHIILDCFHLALCEKCSVTLAQQELGAGKEKTCPKCRSVIRVIHKTY